LLATPDLLVTRAKTTSWRTIVSFCETLIPPPPITFTWWGAYYDVGYIFSTHVRENFQVARIVTIGCDSKEELLNLNSVFWIVTPCSVAVGYQRFGASYWLLPQHYTWSHPRRPRLEFSPPWKHQISEFKIHPNFYTVIPQK
jgi:hypothetical protein